jgi:RNA polymerase sigma-70 factor, ECF subfamily
MPSSFALTTRGHDPVETDASDQSAHQRRRVRSRRVRKRPTPMRAGRPAPARPVAVVPEASDEALIGSISVGDQGAMRVLFARHRVPIYRFVLRLTGDEPIAEDIVSEVFLEVWRRADRFEAKSLVPTWLFAIARHKAISALRRRSEAQLDEDVAAAIGDPADDPETAMDRQSRSAIVERCLRQLPATQREVIDLVYYRHQSVAEVACRIGVPASTVKTRMFNARNRMASLLNEAGLDRTLG